MPAGAAGHGMSANAASAGTEEDMRQELSLLEKQLRNKRKEERETVDLLKSNPNLGVGLQAQLGEKEAEIGRIEKRITELDIQASNISPRGRAAKQSKRLREQFKF